MKLFDSPDLAGMCIRNRPKDAWYQRQKILERIAWCRQNDDAKWRADQVLLELKIPISSYENFKACIGSAPQELSVAEPRPALLLDRANVMAQDFLRELSR